MGGAGAAVPGDRMNAIVLAALALPIAATYLLLQPARGGVSRLFTLGLAIGLGLGIGSATFFLALLLFDGRRAGVLAIDAALLLAGLVVWRRAGPQRPAAPAAWSVSERLLAAAVLVAAAGAALSFLANTLDLPHGRWDAWATWNLRARQLAGAGPAWRTMFTKPTVHGDYPLLVPAAVARLWAYAGDTSVVAPALVAATFAAALALLLYAALAALRGRAQALVGVLCLLGTPLLLRIAPWQYADVPLAFNLLAAIALPFLYDADPPRRRALLPWAGVATGMLAWTKNEGIVLAAIVVSVRAVQMLWRRRAADARAAGWFAAGLLPPALMVLYFKSVLAARTPQLHRDRASMLEQLLDLDRHLAVLRGASWELFRGTFPLAVGLLVYALLLGRTPDRRRRALATSVLPILALGGAAYWLTYVTSRAEITWYVSLSVDRLEMQLWPTALFALLLYVASPSEQVPPESAASGQPARTRRRRSRR